MTAQHTWVQSVFQPLVVATMMTCLAVSVVQLLQLLAPTWNGLYLIAIVFLAALEAMAASRLVHRYRLQGLEGVSFRAGEWLLILIALKLGSYVARGVEALLADIALWREDLWYLLTPEYLVAIGLTWFTWIAATDIERDLTELSSPNVGIWLSRDDIRSRLRARFFWGGIILLLLAGIARIGVAQILNLAHPPVPGIVLNALLYFILGLLLLSQARLTVLQVRWQEHSIPTEAGLSSRWSRTSLAFVLLLVIVSLLLPTSYSYGLLDSIGLVLSLILQVCYFLISLIMLILSLPFLLLLSLLPIETSQVPRGLRVPDIAPVAPPAQIGGPSPWHLLRSLLFWGLVLGMMIYALRSYVGYRKDLLGPWRMHPWLRRLWSFLVGLWQQLRGIVTEAMIPIRSRLASSMPAGASTAPRRLWHWRRLSSMSPRERVQYYYLSIVHRGRQVGRPRHRGETPYEYSGSLGRHKPEVEPDLTDLTEAFVEARYSHHAVTDEQAGRLRQSWNRIKRALRT